MSSARRRGQGRQLTAASAGADRRHSQEQRALGSALAGFLLTLPDFDEIARLVVALLRSPIAARGAARVGTPEGTPVLLGSCPPSLADLVEPGGPDLPAAVMATAAEALAGHAVLPSNEDQLADLGVVPLAAWPLGAGRAPIGSLVVILERPVDEARVQSCVAELVDVITLYLAGALQGPLDPPDDPGDGKRADGPPHFTPRQRDVLHWLEQGMTMRQIASRIGFSDSTVRAESLVIYRGLGVHDRESAIMAARDLGLLDGEVIGGEAALHHSNAIVLSRELEHAASGDGSAA